VARIHFPNFLTYEMDQAGAPEILSRHFLLTLEKGGGWRVARRSFPSFSARTRETRRVPQVRFLNLGLGLAVAGPVSPNSQIPANSFHTLNFHASHSNDTSSIIVIDSNRKPC
jgi:hypothetical protein